MSHRASASGFHVNVAVVTEFFDLAHSLTVWCGFVLGKRLKRHLDQGKQLSVFDFHLVGTHNLTTVFRSRFGRVSVKGLETRVQLRRGGGWDRGSARGKGKTAQLETPRKYAAFRTAWEPG